MQKVSRNMCVNHLHAHWFHPVSRDCDHIDGRAYIYSILYLSMFAYHSASAKLMDHLLLIFIQNSRLFEIKSLP